MKKTTVFYAQGFYLLQGKVNANSVFIEDKQEAHYFMSKAHQRFKGFFKIHEYLLSKDGWSFLVTIEDEQEVLRSYKRLREQSSKADRAKDDKIVWKIISEQIRHFLSLFVRYTNKKQGRTGGKVHSSYERYWFESAEEARSYIHSMRHQYLKTCQRLKRYRGKKKHFRFSKNGQKGSIFLCSLRLKEVDINKHFGIGCIKLVMTFNDVVRIWVKFTKFLHIRSISHQNDPLII